MNIPSALRRAVRDRAKNRCEYCQMPDSVATNGHEIDHVFPIKQGGATTLDNLAYACFKCNRSKGTDIAVLDTDTQNMIRLYNPRRQSWDEHFELDGLLIKGKISVGRATVGLLRMNDSDQIELRRDLIDAGLW